VSRKLKAVIDEIAEPGAGYIARPLRGHPEMVVSLAGTKVLVRRGEFGDTIITPRRARDTVDVSRSRS
jgi:hypothetical protein